MSVIAHNQRDLRSLVVFWLFFLLVKPLLALAPVSEGLLRRMSVLEERAAKDPRVLRGVRIGREVIADAPVERITPDRPGRDRAAVLYLHGGGFIACGIGTHRAVASLLSRELGVPVINTQYRQCPEAGVGTSVADAYRVYRELRGCGDYDEIVVAGDSAGGYLAAKVIERAAHDGIAGPDAYLGFSPLLNLAPGARRSGRRDAMLPIGKIEKLRPFYVRGPEPFTGELDITADAVAAEFPPAVVVCARHEALEKDARDLHAALDRAAVPAQLHIYSGQVHAFPAAVPTLRQSRDAIRVGADFVRRALDEAAERAAVESDTA
ncbi:alpha/beta hydrolase [Gordonia sp. (in: high G+C Gram-positive bacteria)]|uniref:alpha/beta hydrolase n=1 Tax=Gordonia sp. (in: high G+C Gram-positive bacteria) TaxID=84139 RepID=UPI003C7883FB